ncbi:MAG TPA: LacI family DNA-binding transcriptional regulator [Saprospiraceae bacterium]|nr:LacI family DNA-binding transcriptional regulator [Saprospiraceae bacterium]HMQ81443.1 LacI family DNA-binding transcriptional regulator [Saprospiraceae bacterium]
MLKSKTTIHDIAKELNITAATVSRALNGNQAISERTRIAVEDMARKLNYNPNKLAASLRTGKTFTVGVLVPAADRSFFGSIIRGIEEELTQAGYSVIVAQTYEGQQAEIKAIETLLRLQVDGIMASVSKNTQRYEHFESVLKEGIPLLFFDNIWKNMAVSSVTIDDYLGAYRATIHLLEQGCRRIVHLAGLQTSYVYQERLRGYQAALRDWGMQSDPSLVVDCISEVSAGRQVAARVLDITPQVDGVCSSSDFAALGLLQELQAKGCRIPHDIALVGFANEPFTEYVSPALSTVDQCTRHMGYTTARLFLDELSAKVKFVPRSMVLQPELIIRASSKRV